MLLGIDCTSSPPVADLKAANIAFVCRYLSAVNVETQKKLLTLAESAALSRAGIALVSNYEWYADRALEGFASGVQDAQIATSQHAACGGQADRPIYFSVDADVAGDQCAEYFRGVASALGFTRTGAYGSYRVIKYLLDNGLISWAWQTYAWSAGQWDNRAHIQQYSNDMAIAGFSVDFNRSINSDFGQWFQGGNMPIPIGWTDANNALTAINGYKVVAGFRLHILKAAAWNAANQPLEEETYPAQVLLHNASIGGGSRQCFRYSVLWYTQMKGVVEESELGAEIKAAYDLIASLQAQIATLKAQQPTTNSAAIIAALKQLQADSNAAIANVLKAMGDS